MPPSSIAGTRVTKMSAAAQKTAHLIRNTITGLRLLPERLSPVFIGWARGFGVAEGRNCGAIVAGVAD